MKMINKLIKVVVKPLTLSFFSFFFNETEVLSTAPPLWENRRSITASCHLTRGGWVVVLVVVVRVIEKVSWPRGAVSVARLSDGRH